MEILRSAASHNVPSMLSTSLCVSEDETTLIVRDACITNHVLVCMAICFAMRKAFSQQFLLVDRLPNCSVTAFDFTSYTCLRATRLASMYLSLLQLPFFHSFQSRLFSLITFSTFPSHHHVDFRCAGPLVRPHTFSVESSRIFLSLRQFLSTSSVSSQARHRTQIPF